MVGNIPQNQTLGQTISSAMRRSGGFRSNPDEIASLIDRAADTDGNGVVSDAENQALRAQGQVGISKVISDAFKNSQAGYGDLNKKTLADIKAAREEWGNVGASSTDENQVASTSTSSTSATSSLTGATDLASNLTPLLDLFTGGQASGIMNIAKTVIGGLGAIFG
jgi:hypothetical protein